MNRNAGPWLVWMIESTRLRVRTLIVQAPFTNRNFMGIALGMSLGTALATALCFNVGPGMMAGMLPSLAVGSAKEKQDDNHTGDY